MYWYEKKPEGNSIVLSTRVRFARNLEDTPFPSRLKEEEREGVFLRIRQALEEKDLMAVSFSEAEETVKKAYVETRLASKELAQKGRGSGLLLSRGGDLSVMINEEDHIRLQVISPGKSILPSYRIALEWMEEIEKKLPVAYRENLGYLTACPTNLGAGMRISVMIHLPAVTKTGALGALTARLNDAGFTVRGLFGEGSRQDGDIYQISNQMSREKTPQEIAEAFEKVISQVEEWEKTASQTLFCRDPAGEEDRVFRALGTLKYARKMSYSEFIALYSRVRFGREAGLKGTEGTEILDRLFIELLPAPMILRDGSLVSDSLRDRKRSDLLRENLA